AGRAPGPARADRVARRPRPPVVHGRRAAPALRGPAGRAPGPGDGAGVPRGPVPSPGSTGRGRGPLVGARRLRGRAARQRAPELADAVVGVVEAELLHRPAAELAPEVEDALARHVGELDGQLLAELDQRMGREEGARSGVDPTLAALSERRVELLLLAPRLQL